MDLKRTVDIILKDLEEAQAIIDDLKNFPGIPAIQVELAKAKCRNAADVIKFLTEEDLKVPELNDTVKSEGKFSDTDKEIPVKPVETETIEKEETETKEVVETETKEVVETETKKVVETETKEVVETDEETVKNTPTEDKNESISGNGSGKILADTFSHSESLNEMIAGSRKNDGVDDVGNSIPVTDLKKAIGINDRYLFIREIFGGNQEVYGAVINNLNEVNDLDSANTIIRDAAASEFDETVISQLIDLVRRKLHNNGHR